MPDHSSKPILRLEDTSLTNKPSIPEPNEVIEEPGKSIDKTQPVKEPNPETRPRYMGSHNFNPFSIF